MTRDGRKTLRGQMSKRRRILLMEALAMGKTNKVIAHDLNVSENTLKVYVGWLFTDLGCTNRTEVAAHYWRRVVRHNAREHVKRHHDRWVKHIAEQQGDDSAWTMDHEFRKRYGDSEAVWCNLQVQGENGAVPSESALQPDSVD